MFFEKKQYNKAIADYNFSLSLDSTRSFVYRNLGLSYRSLKNYNKAIEYYERAYKNNTSQKDIAAYNLGLVYQYGKDKIKKDIEKAKEWYKNSNYKKAKNKLKELK